MAGFFVWGMMGFEKRRSLIPMSNIPCHAAGSEASNRRHT